MQVALSQRSLGSNDEEVFGEGFSTLCLGVLWSVAGPVLKISLVVSPCNSSCKPFFDMEFL
jgi:hypothetical protein